MTHAARRESGSGVHHVTMRGAGRRRIFEDDRDRRYFVEGLRELVEKDRVELLAWCLMDNHVHMLAKADLLHLSKGLHRLATSYALFFNGRHGHVGPVFQDRFGSLPVETDEHLLMAMRYIHLNPLDLGATFPGDYRSDYGTIDILYGSRSKDDLVQLKEIQDVWMKTEGVNVYLTIDREQEGWDGHVGFVPAYLKELGFDTNKTALLCGPPIMIKFCLASLIEMGFSKEQVYTTLELRMKCGIGKCGRCNIGSKYVCKDGPVFRCDEIDELPNEY